MSGGYTSLESSIRTCKVNTGNADRIESFLIGWDMKDNFKFKNYISR